MSDQNFFLFFIQSEFVNIFFIHVIFFMIRIHLQILADMCNES